MTPWIRLILALCLVAIATGKPGPMRRPRHMVDLTHQLYRDFPTYPGRPKFKLSLVFAGIYKPPGKFYVEMNNFEAAEHSGTHHDAPVHYCKRCWHTENIPVERLVGPGVIINVRNKAANNANYEVTVDDLLNWERNNGEIPVGAYVIMDSGWYKHANNVSKFFGNDKGDTANYEFPGFHPKAAKWLLDNRDISCLGVDTPSLDKARTDSYLTHQLILGRNIIGLEYVNNLDKIPEAGTMIYAFPMLIKNGTGGPTRTIAMWDAGASHHVMTAMLLVCSLISMLV